MEKEIKKVYILWKNALIGNDIELLDDVYTEGFLWTNRMGITKSKSQVIDSIYSGNLKYLSWTDENIDIHFQEEGAVLRSTQILKLKVYDQPIYTRQNVTLHFIKQNNTWRLATLGES